MQINAHDSDSLVAGMLAYYADAANTAARNARETDFHSNAIHYRKKAAEYRAIADAARQEMERRHHAR